MNQPQEPNNGAELIAYSEVEPESKMLLAELERSHPQLTKFVEENPALKGELLKNKEFLGTLLVSYQSTTITRSGPFPPAEEMIAVEKEHKGYIGHLLNTQTKALTIREKLASKNLNFSFAESMIGTLSGLGIAVYALKIAYDLGMAGHDTLAGVIGGGTVIALVTVFVTKQGVKNKQLSKTKEPDKPDPEE